MSYFFIKDMKGRWRHSLKKFQALCQMTVYFSVGYFRIFEYHVPIFKVDLVPVPKIISDNFPELKN